MNKIFLSCACALAALLVFAKASEAQCVDPDLCNINPCDPPLGTDWLWFQCIAADTPCTTACIPPIDPTTCVKYGIQNNYWCSHRRIFSIDICCPGTPPSDSEYTICSLYKWDPATHTSTAWCSRGFTLDSCGDPGGKDYCIQLYSCSPPATDIDTGQWLFVTICHACRKCMWTITFSDGSTCYFDPENIQNFCDPTPINCCNEEGKE